VAGIGHRIPRRNTSAAQALPRGRGIHAGHFAAFEQPELFAADLASFADTLRGLEVF
jgi:pimeloyl-ACP methyl ester carboxylesterase